MYEAFTDIGYGFIKAIDNRGNRVPSQQEDSRPSIYSEMPPGLDGTEAGIYSAFGDFLFGDSASNVSSMPRRFQEYRDCLSDAYAASVLMAISEMNGGNVVECQLVLSLPYQSMRSVDLTAKLLERLAGEHIIKRLGYHKQTINITFPVEYPIMPQNVAPAFVSLAPNGKFKSDATGTIWIGVINVGSKTLELGTFGIDVDSYALRASSQHMTEPKGVYTLVAETEPLLNDSLQDYELSLSEHDIFNILRNGTVQDGKLDIDVSQIIKAAKDNYSQAIHSYCLKNWNANRGKVPKMIYQYCISGGGAHIVAPYLKEVGFHNNIVVSDDPQYDVCVGSRNWHKLIGE